MKSINYSDVKIDHSAEEALKTGDDTLDQFISGVGGFVRGSAIFLTGTPGAGKTTFSVVLQKFFENIKTSLYSREMTNSSVVMQMERYKILHHNAFIVDRSMCASIEDYMRELDDMKPSIVIIDSLQILLKEDFIDVPADTAAFNLIQNLRAWTDKNNAVLIVIGHVNKDGSFEGKNTIEHLFDAHLEMIFDKGKNTRTLSWSKNRKGSIDQTLFYVFGEKSLEFYTAEQYQNIKQEKDLEDFILEAALNFMKSLDRKSPQYKEFQKDLNQQISLIMEANLNRLDTTISCIKVIQKKIEEYNL